MKHYNSQLIEKLAAEYAVGTLRGSARARFEQLLENNPDAQAQVAFWEQRLSEFSHAILPVSPPAQTREAIMDRIREYSAVAQPSPLPAQETLGWRAWIGRCFWPYATGFATAAAIFLAVVALWRGTGPGPEAPPTVLTQPPALEVALVEPPESPVFPIYSAHLKVAASSMSWLVSISADHEELSVTAAEDFLQVGRHTVQLWGLTSSNEAVPLGALPHQRDATTTYRIPAQLRGRHDVRFVISLEGESAEPLDRPRGAVLGEARALDAI